MYALSLMTRSRRYSSGGCTSLLMCLAVYPQQCCGYAGAFRQVGGARSNVRLLTMLGDVLVHGCTRITTISLDFL